MRKKPIKRTVLTTLIYIFLTVEIIITLIPYGWIISTSLKTTVEIYAAIPRWIPINPVLANYREVLFNSSIPAAFLNSTIVAVGAAILALLLGGSTGYALARFKFRGSKFLSLFTLISQMLPLTVLMIPLYYMENSIGLIDTKIGVSIAHLVISLPLVTWMAKGYFAGIPKEIEEASIIDGCGTLQSLVKIIIPLVRPALAATGIYAFISSWNEFLLANVLTRSIGSRTMPIALHEFSSFAEVNWGSTMASSAIITLPVIIIFMCVQRHFVSGLASGAVKG